MGCKQTTVKDAVPHTDRDETDSAHGPTAASAETGKYIIGGNVRSNSSKSSLPQGMSRSTSRLSAGGGGDSVPGAALPSRATIPSSSGRPPRTDSDGAADGAQEAGGHQPTSHFDPLPMPSASPPPLKRTPIDPQSRTDATQAADEYQRRVQAKKDAEEAKVTRARIELFDPIRPVDSFNVTHRALLGRCWDRRIPEVTPIGFVYTTLAQMVADAGGSESLSGASPTLCVNCGSSTRWGDMYEAFSTSPPARGSSQLRRGCGGTAAGPEAGGSAPCPYCGSPAAPTMPNSSFVVNPLVASTIGANGVPRRSHWFSVCGVSTSIVGTKFAVAQSPTGVACMGMGTGMGMGGDGGRPGRGPLSSPVFPSSSSSGASNSLGIPMTDYSAVASLTAAAAYREFARRHTVWPSVDEITKMTLSERVEFCNLLMACNARYYGIKAAYAFRLSEEDTAEEEQDPGTRFLRDCGLSPARGVKVKRWNRVEFFNPTFSTLAQAVAKTQGLQGISREDDPNDAGVRSGAVGPTQAALPRLVRTAQGSQLPQRGPTGSMDSPDPLSGAAMQSLNTTNFSFIGLHHIASATGSLGGGTTASGSSPSRVIVPANGIETATNGSMFTSNASFTYRPPAPGRLARDAGWAAAAHSGSLAADGSLFPMDTVLCLAMEIPSVRMPLLRGVPTTTRSHRPPSLGPGSTTSRRSGRAFPTPGEANHLGSPSSLHGSGVPGSPASGASGGVGGSGGGNVTGITSHLIALNISCFSVSIDPFRWEENRYHRSPIDLDGYKSSSRRKFGEGVITDLMYGGVMIVECSSAEAAQHLLTLLKTMRWTVDGDTADIIGDVKRRFAQYQQARKKQREERKKSRAAAAAAARPATSSVDAEAAAEIENFQYRISRRIGGRPMRTSVELKHISVYFGESVVEEAQTLSLPHDGQGSPQPPRGGDAHRGQQEMDPDSTPSFSRVASAWVGLPAISAVLRTWGTHLLNNPQLAQPTSFFLQRFSGIAPVLQHTTLTGLFHLGGTPSSNPSDSDKEGDDLMIFEDDVNGYRQAEEVDPYARHAPEKHISRFNRFYTSNPGSAAVSPLEHAPMPKSASRETLALVDAGSGGAFDRRYGSSFGEPPTSHSHSHDSPEMGPTRGPGLQSMRWSGETMTALAPTPTERAVAHSAGPSVRGAAAHPSGYRAQKPRPYPAPLQPWEPLPPSLHDMSKGTSHPHHPIGDGDDDDDDDNDTATHSPDGIARTGTAVFGSSDGSDPPGREVTLVPRGDSISTVGGRSWRSPNASVTTAPGTPAMTGHAARRSEVTFTVDADDTASVGSHEHPLPLHRSSSSSAPSAGASAKADAKASNGAKPPVRVDCADRVIRKKRVVKKKKNAGVEKDSLENTAKPSSLNRRAPAAKATQRKKKEELITLEAASKQSSAFTTSTVRPSSVRLSPASHGQELEDLWRIADLEVKAQRQELEEIQEVRRQAEEKRNMLSDQLRTLQKAFVPHTSVAELDLMFLYLKTALFEPEDLPNSRAFFNSADWLPMLMALWTSPGNTIACVEIATPLTSHDIPRLGIVGGLLYHKYAASPLQRLEINATRIFGDPAHRSSGRHRRTSASGSDESINPRSGGSGTKKGPSSKRHQLLVTRLREKAKHRGRGDHPDHFRSSGEDDDDDDGYDSGSPLLFNPNSLSNASFGAGAGTFSPPFYVNPEQARDTLWLLLCSIAENVASPRFHLRLQGFPSRLPRKEREAALQLEAEQNRRAVTATEAPPAKSMKSTSALASFLGLTKDNNTSGGGRVARPPPSSDTKTASLPGAQLTLDSFLVQTSAEGSGSVAPGGLTPAQTYTTFSQAGMSRLGSAVVADESMLLDSEGSPLTGLTRAGGAADSSIPAQQQQQQRRPGPRDGYAVKETWKLPRVGSYQPMTHVHKAVPQSWMHADAQVLVMPFFSILYHPCTSLPTQFIRDQQRELSGRMVPLLNGTGGAGAGSTRVGGMCPPNPCIDHRHNDYTYQHNNADFYIPIARQRRLAELSLATSQRHRAHWAGAESEGGPPLQAPTSDFRKDAASAGASLVAWEMNDRCLLEGSVYGLKSAEEEASVYAEEDRRLLRHSDEIWAVLRKATHHFNQAAAAAANDGSSKPRKEERGSDKAQARRVVLLER